MTGALLQEVTALARKIGGELTWFADRMEGLPRSADAVPQSVPVLAGLPRRCTDTVPLTAPCTRAFLDAAADLPWVQSYTAEDGFSRGYLENYGFVNVVSPIGLFHSDDMRISIGFWGEGLRYPLHSHAPEEWYVMLSGGCTLTSEGTGARPVMAGNVTHHTPWQRHAADFDHGPLLALAFWRGDGLMNKSTIHEVR